MGFGAFVLRGGLLPLNSLYVNYIQVEMRRLRIELRSDVGSRQNGYAHAKFEPMYSLDLCLPGPGNLFLIARQDSGQAQHLHLRMQSKRASSHLAVSSPWHPRRNPS